MSENQYLFADTPNKQIPTTTTQQSPTFLFGSFNCQCQCQCQCQCGEEVGQGHQAHDDDDADDVVFRWPSSPPFQTKTGTCVLFVVTLSQQKVKCTGLGHHTSYRLLSNLRTRTHSVSRSLRRNGLWLGRARCCVVCHFVAPIDRYDQGAWVCLSWPSSRLQVYMFVSA